MYGLYGEPALKMLFFDGEQYCKNWFNSYELSKYTGIGVGCWIAFMNIVMTVTFQVLGKVYRGRSSSSNHEAMMHNIFICQFLNTGIVLLVVFNSFVYDKRYIELHMKDSFFMGPFDEFDSDWFLRIGTALLYAQLAMLFFPHIFTILQSIGLSCVRCFDRSCSFNDKQTKKIIQSEYEDLYTGPEFILHVRYAQVLSTIYVTLAYSSGMPLLYLLNFCILFVQYWVDKILVFNYYKKTPQFTRHLSRSVVNLLPWTLVLHALFGMMIYSYPYIWKSDVRPWFGNNSVYFNPNRMGQVHVVGFFIMSVCVLLFFVFEKPLVLGWRRLSGAVGRTLGYCVAKLVGLEYDGKDRGKQGFVYSDDLYYECSYG